VASESFNLCRCSLTSDAVGCVAEGKLLRRLYRELLGFVSTATSIFSSLKNKGDKKKIRKQVRVIVVVIKQIIRGDKNHIFYFKIPLIVLLEQCLLNMLPNSSLNC